MHNNKEGLATLEGLNAIRCMVALKADMTDLERLYEIKINKVDFENVLDVQSVMSK